MVMIHTFDRRYIHIVKVSFHLYIRKKKFTSLKIKQVSSYLQFHSLLNVTVHSSLKHKQHDVIDDICIPKSSRTRHEQGRNSLLKVDFLSWQKLLTTILFQKKSVKILLCINFHKHIFTIGQQQTSLLNHCISTQRRPYARPRNVPHSLLSFTNNTPFYYKQLLHSLYNAAQCAALYKVPKELLLSKQCFNSNW